MPIFTGIAQNTTYNRPIYGVHGQYTLSSGIALPYFLTALAIDRAIDELKIADQIPPHLDTRWSLNELFQREVSRKRVQEEIVQGYLADPNKLKFFNAITIVLMPLDANNQVLDTFAPSPSPPPIPFEQGNAEDAAWSDGVVRNFGGVQYVTHGSQARLRWDTASVHAVAVDGQHRLVALSEFRDTVRVKVLSPEEKLTTIPIVFLLLSEKAGYHNVDAGKTVRAVSRELFTDLNKNARTVDRARELILDDRSLAARCVRTLITDDTARDSADRLPLSLVRWQDANHRFDTSYYINSLVHLDLLVTDALLGFDDLKPTLDRDKVVDYLDTVGKTLGGDRVTLKDAAGRSAIEVYTSENLSPDGEPQIPFWGLTGTFLDAATAGFTQHFRPWVVRLLSEPAPYARVLNYARDNNLIEGQFGKFHAQTELHRNALLEQFKREDETWYTTSIKQHIDHIEGLKGRGNETNWAFKTIFQKAMVRLARMAAFEVPTDPLLGGIDRVISFVDTMDQKGVLLVGAPLDTEEFSLWTFIATNPVGGTIKVSAKTEERILALLKLWYYAICKTKADVSSGSTPPSARQLVKFFSAETNNSTWPGCAKACSILRDAYGSRVFLREQYGTDAADGVIRSRITSVLSVCL